MRALIVVAAIASFFPGIAAASPPPRVAVLTMTPGPYVAEQFGHTAIRVDDLVYNFGTFDGNDPDLIYKFLSRKLVYWLSVSNFRDFQHHYDNRTMTVQELALDESEARRIAELLAENAKPEKREYIYDFFVDNCASRVRDAVDAALGGYLKKAAQERPGVSTYRGHVAKVLGPNPPLARAVDLVLNGYVDQKITRFEDAFLTDELENLLRETRRSDGRPLVASERSIVGSRFHPVEQGSFLPIVLPGALIILLLVIAATDGGRRPVTRVIGGIGVALVGLGAGALGCGLVVTSLTSFDCARWNGNLLEMSPLAFVLVFFGIAVAVNRASLKRMRSLRTSLYMGIGVALCDLASHLVGAARQHHLDSVLGGVAVPLLCLLAVRAVQPRAPVDAGAAKTHA